MDLTPEEQQQLILELNPHLAKGVSVDANWTRLQLERAKPKPRFDTTHTVQTQTPTVLEFESHNSFTYRRNDGAHWHTELRNLDNTRGFAPEQAQFVDSFNTLLSVQQLESFKWHTPITPQGDYDTRYQLAKRNNTWYCLIDLKLYKASTRRLREDRGYTEIQFSTRNTPIATLEQCEELLDILL